MHPTALTLTPSAGAVVVFPVVFRSHRLTASRKTVAKSARPAPRSAPRKAGGKPFAKGADPRRGVGKKGRSGRKPVEFYLGCEDATANVVLPKVLDYLEQHELDPSDAAWQWCAQYVSRYARSDAPKRVEMTGKDGGPMEVNVEDVRDRIARRIARLAHPE